MRDGWVTSLKMVGISVDRKWASSFSRGIWCVFSGVLLSMRRVTLFFLSLFPGLFTPL